MAIYHFSAKIISRGGGRSAIAAAAYRATEMLDDHLTSQVHDYTAKQGVAHSEILLPAGAPARFLDRSVLWNEVEAKERRKDSQLARDVEIALPRELSRTEAIALVRDFVSEQFVARGMIADLNVHWGKTADGEKQPHAHVMLTMRSVSEEGFGPKVREWNSTTLLTDWRERWAELANERLCALGHDARIDHRSNAEQEIPLQPQHKIGPAGARREARGEDAERADEHRAIARENGARLLQEPEIALRALTHQHSTFSKRDLARFVSRHSDGADQFTAVMAVVQASPELVRVGEDGRGQERFSTREMLETEARLERDALALAAASGHAVSERDKATALRRTSAGSGAGSGGLGIEQQAAFVHVTGDADLAVVVGFAGTGKSTMLGTARIAWEAAGYRVHGSALSGIAAEGLEGGSGIESRTIHRRLHAWAQGREELTARDVLVVDEAGMIGSRMMDQLMSRVREAGAKLVLVGDPEQLQAIEAGAAFRAIADRVGTVEITEVRRQRAAWQRTATRELATSGTAAALERYTEAGMVHASATLVEAKAALVAGWDLERQRQPNESRVMLASTRADVTDLNQLARGRLQAAGALGSDHVVQTERGERSFANGDRLMFLRNERGLGGNAGGRNSVAVKNGTLGTLMAVESGGERLTVRLDGAGPEGSSNSRHVTFYLRDYAHLDHGYAATVHKAQGVTVDRAHVLATEMMDRHAAYVGLTRHRDGVALHYARETFGDAVQLARALGRERAKDTTLDYGSGDLAQRYGARRGLVPESEIVLPAAAARQAREVELARDVAAGRARFRDRFAAHRQQRQAAAERDEQARGLVGQWDQLIKSYGAALPGLDRDPVYVAARQKLLGFGQHVRERPELVAVLRERGAEFGMAERPNLQRVLADPKPEQVIDGIVAQSENAQRAQAAAYQERVRQAAEVARRAQEQRPRGPRMGM
nr:Ti-type conjugative transfer relaxase TraA [Lichenicola cladoniae]